MSSVRHSPLTAQTITTDDCRVDALSDIIRSGTAVQSMPMAAEVEKNIPIYCGATINAKIDDLHFINSLLAEWNQVFDQGAGALVIRQAFVDNARQPVQTAECGMRTKNWRWQTRRCLPGITPTRSYTLPVGHGLAPDIR